MKRISVLFLTGIIVLVLSEISFSGETYTYTTDAFSEGSGGLDHYYAYSWAIKLVDSEGYGFDNETETLDSVTLIFHDIYDTTIKDILQISTLDSKYVVDGEIDSYEDYTTSWYRRWSTPDEGNYFDTYAFDGGNNSAAELLFTLKDIDNKGDGTNNLPSGANEISVTYKSNGTVEYTVIGDDEVQYATTYDGSVIDALTAYISNNVLTLGLDPDCHYYASSISLILNTSDSTGASHAPEPETLVLFGLGLLGASAFGRKRFSSLG